MEKPSLKTISSYCLWVTVFVIVSGLLSYLTANGHKVIGPDPDSVEAQQIAIVVNTLWWAGSFGAFAVLAFVMDKRLHKSHR